MFANLERTNVAELHLHRDPHSGLRALIAIHSTQLGPAVGGCRCLRYDDEDAALQDVTRLARGMSYKAALAGLPLGGGKAVILEPPDGYDRGALYRAFGRAVDSLNGRYTTAVDAGTRLEDLDQVARTTRHVWGYSGDGLDPSPLTALGVFAALDASVRQRLGRDSLRGLHFAVQGVGHVGSRLALLLTRAGARLTLADADAKRAGELAARLGARIVPPDAIYDVPCDGFVPCALGAVLNRGTIARLHAPLVAGSANNQLAGEEDGERLRRRDILYAPDYVTNAGGLIALALGHSGAGRTRIRQQVLAIGTTLTQIFREAERAGWSTSATADDLAEQRLNGHRNVA